MKGPANFILYETCNDRIPFLSVNAVLVCIVSTVIDFPLLSEVSKQPKNICSTGKGPLVESLTYTAVGQLRGSQGAICASKIPNPIGGLACFGPFRLGSKCVFRNSVHQILKWSLFLDDVH